VANLVAHGCVAMSAIGFVCVAKPPPAPLAALRSHLMEYPKELQPQAAAVLLAAGMWSDYV